MVLLNVVPSAAASRLQARLERAAPENADAEAAAEAAKRLEEAAAAEAERKRKEEFEEHRKRVGLGMLSSRFQRFEVSVSGEQRGPDAFDRRAANSSSKDATYARFFPGANGGRPTTHAELQKIVAAQEGGGLQSSAGRGKFLAAPRRARARAPRRSDRSGSWWQRGIRYDIKYEIRLLQPQRAHITHTVWPGAHREIRRRWRASSGAPS